MLFRLSRECKNLVRAIMIFWNCQENIRFLGHHKMMLQNLTPCFSCFHEKYISHTQHRFYE